MSYADRIRDMDTTGMTARQVAAKVGCQLETARNTLNRLKKPYISLLAKRSRPTTPTWHDKRPDFASIEKKWARMLNGWRYDMPAGRR